MKKLQMNEAPVEVKKELSEPAVVVAPAPEAPAVETPAVVEAPKAELAEMPADKPAEKMAEPTLTDIAGMLAELLALMKADATQDVTEAPAAPAEDMAKPYGMSAKSDEKTSTTLEKAKADAAGAVAVPAESSQPLGRAEILNQFNAEKNPARRSELLRKLGL